MAFVVLALSFLVTQSDEPEPVAMVLGVQGDVKLRRMDPLRPGDQVRVPASGTVRLVFFADGHRETLKPGRTVKIAEAGGTPVDAVIREKTKLPASQLDGLRTMAASARAGVSRVRDVGAAPLPVSPISESIVLSDRPAFAWAPVNDAEWYDVHVFRSEGNQKENLVWSTRVRNARIGYPKDRDALRRGEVFTWKVVERGKVVAKGKFTVATEEEAGDFEPVRKLSQSADISDRLLGAMLFETGQVFDESHRAFESLVKELPNEPWVLLACARHLGRLGRVEDAKTMEKRARALASGSG